MRFLSWQKRAPTIGGIEGAVNEAVTGDPRLRDFEAPGIHVSVNRDEIRLTGAVSTSEARDLAGRLAAALPGVTRVRNELRTDADLTKALRTALAGHPGTTDLARDSIVFHGVAELQGRATYDGQLAAKKMASAIDDVRDVADHTVWPAAA
jgi:osmotically-inducible protein OsmY